ncbi:head GIN domain-containing protein [Flavobacterium sp. SUN052]|uniref:head GIN domain-containing protein n=1 Tax=Flavobacterium sp. SUN052 TaxID=3002441 RepID=UPI00237EE9B0|nr:head GIN domain-containing protein [Flavobacterium sp. SUN052]MEC4004698.1 head GIN domain-containing protein [Flavobacterium sp. SUN052]
MKKIYLFLSFLVVLTSCEKPSECFESTGDMVTRTISVNSFSKIKIYRGIAVVITQGADYKVEIQTGSNLIDNIEVTQNGNQLVFKDNTTCNWLRDYGQTTIYITTPNLEEIYSKTERNISSNGVLTYPILRIFALDKDGDGEEGAGTGDFYINVNNSQLVIENNNVSRYFISGTTSEALLNLYAGDGRIDAQNLTAQSIKVYHRGSNDMIVKPIQSITGKMVSTGNIILKNNPPIVDVQELYQGHVIYN